MKGKKRRRTPRSKIQCNEWDRGLCRAVSKDQGTPLYCPVVRAAHALPGECCHHPNFDKRNMLEEMKKGGVDLSKFVDRLRQPGFIERLYQAWLRKSGKSKG